MDNNNNQAVLLTKGEPIVKQPPNVEFMISTIFTGCLQYRLEIHGMFWEIMAAKNNFSLLKEYLFTEASLLRNGSACVTWTLTQRVARPRLVIGDRDRDFKI